MCLFAQKLFIFSQHFSRCFFPTTAFSRTMKVELNVILLHFVFNNFFFPLLLPHAFSRFYLLLTLSKTFTTFSTAFHQCLPKFFLPCLRSSSFSGLLCSSSFSSSTCFFLFCFILFSYAYYDALSALRVNRGCYEIVAFGLFSWVAYRGGCRYIYIYFFAKFFPFHVDNSTLSSTFVFVLLLIPSWFVGLGFNRLGVEGAYSWPITSEEEVAMLLWLAESRNLDAIDNFMICQQMIDDIVSICFFVFDIE